MKFHSINQTRSSILLPKKFKFKVKTIKILQRGMTIAKKVEKNVFPEQQYYYCLEEFVSIKTILTNN